MIRSRLADYGRRLKRWATSFPASLIIGVLLGVLAVHFLQSSVSFVGGIVLGIILEQMFLGVKRVREEWQNSHPLCIMLGSIASNLECYIFFSSFYRDLNHPSEFQLARWDGQTGQEVLISGPDFVLGEGDAIALSLIQSLLARIRKNPQQIIVGRGDREMDKWGVNAFCIGAHNGKTRVILEKFKNPYFIFDNNYAVITKPDAPLQPYGSTGHQLGKGVFIIPGDDAEPTDYGIILKFRDQFNKNGSVIFIVAGIGSVGTSGAAYYMLTNYKELAKLGDEFGVLIEVPSGFQSARQVEFDQVCQSYIKK